MEPIKNENLIISQNKIYKNNPIKSQIIYLFPCYHDTNSNSFHDENSENEEHEIPNFEDKNNKINTKKIEEVKKNKNKSKVNKKKKSYKKFNIKKTKSKTLKEEEVKSLKVKDFLNLNDFDSQSEKKVKSNGYNSRKETEKKNPNLINKNKISLINEKNIQDIKKEKNNIKRIINELKLNEIEKSELINEYICNSYINKKLLFNNLPLNGDKIFINDNKKDLNEEKYIENMNNNIIINNRNINIENVFRNNITNINNNFILNYNQNNLYDFYNSNLFFYDNQQNNYNYIDNPVQNNNFNEQPTSIYHNNNYNIYNKTDSFNMNNNTIIKKEKIFQNKGSFIDTIINSNLKKEEIKSNQSNENSLNQNCKLNINNNNKIIDLFNDNNDNLINGHKIINKPQFIQENNYLQNQKENTKKKYILMSETLIRIPIRYNPNKGKPFILSHKTEDNNTLFNLKIKIPNQDKEIYISIKKDENQIEKINELKINKELIPRIHKEVNKYLNYLNLSKSYNLTLNSYEQLKIINKYMNDKQEKKKDNSFYYEKEKLNQLINKYDLSNEVTL